MGRVLAFIAFGFAAGLFYFAPLYLHSWMPPGLYWALSATEFSCYIIGGVFHASMWPERSFPGRFQLVGASHQIFHVFVLVAAVLHSRNVRAAYAHTQQQMASC